MPTDVGALCHLLTLQASDGEIGADTVNSFFDHVLNSRLSAILSSAPVALQRCRVPAQNPQNGTMNSSDAERERRRSALIQFWETNKAGLKNVKRWAEASEVGYNTLYEFIKRRKDKNMLAATYEKLAEGASLLLNRKVTLKELLMEEAEPQISERDSRIERIATLITQLPDPEQHALEELLRSRLMHHD